MNSKEYLASLYPQSTFPWITKDGKFLAYGGNQAWFSRKTAGIGGCGPVAAANALSALCRTHKVVSRRLHLDISPDGLLEFDNYHSFMEQVYKTIGSWEIPIYRKIYDVTGKKWKFGIQLQPSYGGSVWRYLKKTIQFAYNHKVYLHSHFMPAAFCSRKKALSFIAQGIAESGSVAVLTARNVHPLDTYAFPYTPTSTPAPQTIRNHFFTVTGIRKRDDDSYELLGTTWGKISIIDFEELYQSWQSIRCVDASLTYFTIASDSKESLHDMVKAPFQLLYSLFCCLFGFMTIPFQNR